MNILAIETSCDETAVSLVKAEKNSFYVVDEYVSSQTKVHSPFGGVVPNLAAREHLRNLPSLLNKIIAKNKLNSARVDLPAVTQGPGLIPALLIGTNSAKTLAFAWKKPLVGTHHIAGHIYANLISSCNRNDFSANGDEEIPTNTGSPRSIQSLAMTKKIFPILALIVSGGHTQLILMRRHTDFRIVGETLDDAAGEAFDKVANILNLGYPGGPAIASLADKFQNSKCKIQNAKFFLPRPMINSKNLNFSFSGLKTAVLYLVKKNPEILKDKNLTAAISAEFQQAIIDVLVSKTLKAAAKFKPKAILLGGGVTANSELRKQMGESIEKNLKNTFYFIPDIFYSLDNASMMAVAAYFQYRKTKSKKIFFENWINMEADASLPLK